MDNGLRVLAQLDSLAREGARHLREISGDDLAGAWWAATDDLERWLPPDLRWRMAEAAGLSPEGLDAGLGVVVRGVRTEAARAMLQSTRAPTEPLAPARVVLASNLPGLALQCLLPALAARRPLLLKTPSSEPDFTPWLLRRLTEAEPRFGSALAAATWRGGDHVVEEAVLPRVERVVAYGSDGALTDLGQRFDATLVDHGHRISVGVVMSAPEDAFEGFVEDTARGLARDVALFDQRGCLSVHSVLATPDVCEALARSLADQLARLAVVLPSGPADAGQLAEVRAAREEAVMAGYRVFELPLRQGTVILETALLETDDHLEPVRLESPGLRTVRFVPVSSRDVLVRALGSWRGRLQGVALADSQAVEPTLAEDLLTLGVTRIAPVGRLQEVDAAVWRNGGRSPLSAYLESPTFPSR